MYLARYAPGAPTPWLMTLPWDQVLRFERQISAIVEKENGKK